MPGPLLDVESGDLPLAVAAARGAEVVPDGGAGRRHVRYLLDDRKAG